MLRLLSFLYRPSYGSLRGLGEEILWLHCVSFGASENFGT
jgi:hypothetical protein